MNASSTPSPSWLLSFRARAPWATVSAPRPNRRAFCTTFAALDRFSTTFTAIVSASSAASAILKRSISTV